MNGSPSTEENDRLPGIPRPVPGNQKRQLVR